MDLRRTWAVRHDELASGTLSGSDRHIRTRRARGSASVGTMGSRILPACILMLAVGCPPEQVLSPDGDDEPQLVAPALFEAEVPPFTVLVTADRSSGVPGTLFNLEAHVSSNQSPVTIHFWKLDDVLVGSGPNLALTIPTPGDHIVDLTVTDSQGQSVTEGLLLKVFEPAAASRISASSILPAAGMPGTFVRIEAITLNDPAAFCQLQVGDGQLFEPYRPELGVATFLIPIDAADGLTAATPTTIRLFADGQEREQFAFTLSPWPALAGPPGDLIRQWLLHGADLIPQLEAGLLTIVGDLDAGLSADEQAMLQGMLHLAKARFEQVRDALIPILDGYDEQTLTVIDQVLTANGVDTAILAGASPTNKGIRLGKNQNDQVLDATCQYHLLMKALRDFAKAASNAGAVVALLGFETAGAAITPAVMAMANLVTELDIASDILEELDELIPRPQNPLEVTATPSTLLQENDKAVIRVTAHLKIDTDICQGLLDSFIEEIALRTANRLLSRIALPRLARLVTRRSFIAFGEVGRLETLAEMQFFLREFVRGITKLVADATGIDSLFQDAKIKLCALNERSQLRLQPEQMILTLSPSDGGRLLNLQEETIDFYCDINRQGPVTITAERECGLEKLKGQVDVRCREDSCTEDAGASVRLLVTPRQFDIRDDEGMCDDKFKDQFHTRWVDVTFINEHPTRQVAIAWIEIEESDLQSIEPGPCPRLAHMPFAGLTVEECVLSRSCGLIQYSPGNTGLVELLDPGEQVGPYPVLCERTDYNALDLNVDGDGCDDLVLETFRRKILAHAVFCNNLANRKANFCDPVGRHLHEIGLPYPGYTQLQSSECP